MKKLLPTLLLFLLAWTPGFVCAQANRSRAEASRSSGPAVDSFRIIYDRNIFSANRRAGRPADRPATETISQPQERIFLTGTLIQTTGSVRDCVAFFEGSRTEYNASHKLGESIAGFRIAEIRTEGVRLERNDERIVIPVACGLSRQGEGKWQAVSESDSPVRRGSDYGERRGSDSGGRRESDSGGRRGSDFGGRRGRDSRSGPSSERPSAPTGEAAKTPPSGLSTDEILKKLMERRQQEEQR
jgi:hypothetical protein